MQISPQAARTDARLAALAFLAVLLISRTAFAEVMDKELSVSEIWFWSLASGVAGLLGWPAFRPLAAIGAGLGLLMLVSVLTELADPAVGPAILREAGPEYPVHVWAALLVAISLHMLGIVARRTLRRRRVVLTPGNQE